MPSARAQADRAQIDGRELATAASEDCHELLDDAAPVGRIFARRGAVHDHPGNRELALEAFAAGFEIDRRRPAIGLLVERRARCCSGRPKRRAASRPCRSHAASVATAGATAFTVTDGAGVAAMLTAAAG